MALFVDVDDTNIPAKQTQSQVMDHAYEKDDQLVLSFPVSFVSVDLNIQFGSFGLSNDGSDVSSHEPILIDLLENMICEGVDDINDGQTIPRFEDAKLIEQIKNDRISIEETSTMLVYNEATKTQQIDHGTAVKELSNTDAEPDISSHEPILIDPQENVSCEGVDHGQMLPRFEEEDLHEQDAQIHVKRGERFTDKFNTDDDFWEECIDEPFNVDEIEVVKEELKSVTGEQAYDENKADEFEEFEHITENESDIEDIEAKVIEEILSEKNTNANKAQERNKQNDEKARTLAEIQAQKKAQLREKRRIKRLRKKEKQRAGGDASESSKATRPWGNMVVITVMVLALSVLSFTNADLSMFVSSHH